MSIRVTLKDGAALEFAPGVTVQEVAAQISKRLEKEALIGEVDGEPRDLSFPINSDAVVHILTFADPRGRDAFRHTSSHILAQAVLRLFPKLSSGLGLPLTVGSTMILMFLAPSLLRTW